MSDVQLFKCYSFSPNVVVSQSLDLLKNRKNVKTLVMKRMKERRSDEE